jgi:hypothetical protein
MRTKIGDLYQNCYYNAIYGSPAVETEWNSQLKWEIQEVHFNPHPLNSTNFLSMISLIMIFE